MVGNPDPGKGYFLCTTNVKTFRNDVTEDMVRAMIYNGLEDLSEHPIDVVTVPGDHEGMLSVSQAVE